MPELGEDPGQFVEATPAERGPGPEAVECVVCGFQCCVVAVDADELEVVTAVEEGGGVAPGDVDDFRRKALDVAREALSGGPGLSLAPM